ncbi:cupin-2 domain-containing protein [Favolaschia claudopus]|uniref:Cupin-2 domain-containing protein n=1 Tax=Favolaschia claudopus TaxID=2862362 RepID=A0AAW0AUP3_9AGAR
MSSVPTPTSPLPNVRRVVTGHNPSTGQSLILADTTQPPTFWSPDSVNAKFDLYYTGSVPAVNDAELNMHIENKKLKESDEHLKHNGWVDEIAEHPELISPQGSTFRAFEFAPGSVSPMHRTISLDYGIVAKGTIVLEMEDGSRVTLTEGDTLVQRGGMHCWRNETSEWGRMYFVGLGAQPVKVNGQELKEEWRVAK